MAIQIKGGCPLLQVFDMPASIAFYRDILGFEVIDAAPEKGDWDWAWLRQEDFELMLNTAYESQQRPAAPDSDRVRAHADTALYFGCPDIDAARQHLLANGCEVGEPTVASYGMRQLHVEDPDGYQLCLQWPA